MRLNIVKFLLVGMFLLVGTILISAVPPVQTTVTGDNSFTLKYPADTILKQNQDYRFEFHVYNTSDGLPITSGINCYFHLFNSSGKHLIELESSSPDLFDYSFDVDGGNFSEVGDYCYVAQCNSSTQGGYVSVPFSVTKTGEDIGLNQSITIIGQLGLLALFLALGFNFSNERWKVRFFFFMVSLLMGILILNSIRIIASASSDLEKMMEMSLILGIIVLVFMFLYLFIHALIELFHYFKSRKNMKWQV